MSPTIVAITLLGDLAFPVGLILFAVGAFAESAAPIVGVLGASIACAAFVWPGVSLLSASDTPIRRAASVS